jgi:SSS family solute:Na+ symporter
MISTLFFTLLAFFAIVYIVIGKKVSSKIKTQEDYFFSKRTLGFFSLSLTLLATQLGGGALLGACDEAYLKGWSVLFYPLGMSLGLIVLSLGFGENLRKLKLNTIAEIFKKIYESKNLQKIVSSLSIITLFFILVAQAIAARKFFCAIGFDMNFVFLGFFAVVILYTVIGGLKGVVNSDIVQTIFMCSVFFLVFFIAQKSFPVSISPTDFKFSEKIPWMGWFLMPLLFMVIEQDMGQRYFSAKNKKIVKTSGIIAAIFLMICSSFAVYFGVLARKLGLDISSKSGVLMSVVSYTTTPVVSTVFACAVLMAIISTADSLLCAISSNIAFDFSFFKNMNMKKKLITSKTITCFVGISAVLCSYFFNNVLFLLIQSYEFSVSILFTPIAMAILLKKVSKKAAIASMVIGAICFFGFKIWEPPLPKEVLTLFCSLIGFLIVNGICYKTEKEKELEMVEVE